ncbi:MAG: magnesium transporter [Bacteroidetes bacterium]|nr:magnesium transporter [Bacteroidota bacterium]
MPDSATDIVKIPPLPELNEEIAEAVEERLGEENFAAAIDLVRELHPADIARLITELSREHAASLTLALPTITGAQVLSELDETFCADLLAATPTERITSLLNELESDDAADVLGQLDKTVRQRVLRVLEDREAVRGLLAYGEDTAGGIMAAEVVTVLANWTVAEATEEIRRNAEDTQDLYVVFVTEPSKRLEGFVTIRRLLLSPAEAIIGDVMRTNVRYVTTDVDQEEVARIMERYDLVSLAVVDDEHRLVGHVAIDDAMDVILEEAEEDYQRLSGITGDEEPTDSVFRITRGRLPWLFLGMVGAVFAGSVIGVYEENIRRASVLAAFIPVVMAMAGNAGIQSSAIIVQGLASGEVWSANMFRRLSKEVLVAIVNGLALAMMMVVVVLLLFGWVATVWSSVVMPAPEPMRLAITAGLSLFAVIVLAAVIGVATPLMLDRIGVDPALATGPFITTSNDIIGLIVFFMLAATLYLPFV